MARQNTRRMAAALVLALLIAACAPAPSAAPAASEPADAPAAEAAPTEAPAAEESAAASEDSPSGMRVFVIVPEESTASYVADEEFFGGALAKYGIGAGRQDTVGSTNAIQGQFALNWDDLSTPLGENHFTVDLSTLSSDQGLRDSWLRENGPEFDAYPTATFVAERLENAPTSYTEGEEVSFQMVGQLTVRETAQPATFNVTASLNGDTVTGVAETRILLTDYGIDPPSFANTLTVKDEMGIRVEFTAREQ